jgi:FkbM family methyltransferase
MERPRRPQAFIIASTDHGTMIVNRFDQHAAAPDRIYGAGFQLLNKASYDPEEVSLLLTVLNMRRNYYGDGVVALDCGANLGVHTVEWAKHMTGWGVVMAFEAQERIYYALAGNIAINNCFNARAVNAAVTSEPGAMKIPRPNYLVNSSFGSLELKQRDNTEFIGQPIDYSEQNMTEVRAITLDSYNFQRIDLIKIDVEGMELDVLAGAARSIAANRPIMLIEVMKTDANALRAWLEKLGYIVIPSGMNVLAIHQDDKCRASIKIETPGQAPAA